MTNFQNEVHAILEELEEILIKKNIDYGNSFDDQMDEWGLVAGAIRISDKLNRLKQLINPKHEQQVNDEALEDTVGDLAGYAVLLKRYLLNQKRNSDK